jgi:hypothetical protein
MEEGLISSVFVCLHCYGPVVRHNIKEACDREAAYLMAIGKQNERWEGAGEQGTPSQGTPQ